MAIIRMENLCKSYDGKYLAVNHMNLVIKDHDFCVLLSPSGCGKTTLLRMIAGLEPITSGDLYLDDMHLNNVLPKDRNIAMVFQSYALYPHMTVYDNMAFGLKMKKTPMDKIKPRIDSACEYLLLDEYIKRKPRNLSGGQQQRVALGRALVKEPKVFLMDEPLSNLDAKLRGQTRETIVNIHERANATTIYVTHDQVEAMTMGTKIVVMNRGVMQQVGTPEEIFEKPVNLFVAGFIGSPSINLIKGKVENGRFVAPGAQCALPKVLAKNAALEGKAVTLGIRPEFLHIAAEDETAEITATPYFIERLGAELIVNSRMSDGQIIVAKVRKTAGLSAGTPVQIAAETENLLLFDTETEQAIY